MNEFDAKAGGRDNDPMHRDRSAAIANEMLKAVPVSKKMTVLEYDAGSQEHDHFLL